MPHRICLLRGINVGGRNIVPMKPLCAMLSEHGYGEVKSVIQSGNLVFEVPAKRSDAALAAEISDLIEKGFDVKPRAFVLKEDAFRSTIEDNLFADRPDAEKSVHFWFLDGKPASSGLKKLEELKTDSESFELNGPVFYLHAPDGIGRSKLAEVVEKALGVPTTARKLSTLLKMLALLEG